MTVHNTLNTFSWTLYKNWKYAKGGVSWGGLTYVSQSRPW